MKTARTISLPQYRAAGEVALYICSCIASPGTQQLSIDRLCRKFGHSKTVLARAFRQRHGTTIHAYIIQQKMLTAKAYLSDRALRVKEIAYLLGYSELSNFSRDFSRITGMSPNAFRSSMVRDSATVLWRRESETWC